MKYLTAQSRQPVSMLSNVDRMFNHFFETAAAPVSRGFATDIAETSEGYQIQADLPGFSATDIDVRIEDNLLVIEAKVDEETENNENQVTWYLRERSKGERKRSFLLPEDVDKNAINATMENGILLVDLTKKPEVKPRNIKVQGK